MHKRQLQASLDSTLERSLIDEVNALSLLSASADAAEAFAAFSEKRDPEFTGGRGRRPEKRVLQASNPCSRAIVFSDPRESPDDTSDLNRHPRGA